MELQAGGIEKLRGVAAGMRFSIRPLGRMRGKGYFTWEFVVI